MMDAVSPRDRRTLIAGAAIVATLVGVSWGLPRLGVWRSAAFADAEREAAALARVEESVQQFSRTTAALAAASSELAAVDSMLLHGATTSTAGTTLAAAISEAAEGTESQLGSIQVQSDSGGHGTVVRVAARATVSGDAESLALFLESLEAGFPLLSVREWSINGGTTSIAPTQRMVLRMDVLVEGLAAATTGVRTR